MATYKRAGSWIPCFILGETPDGILLIGYWWQGVRYQTRAARELVRT